MVKILYSLIKKYSISYDLTDKIPLKQLNDYVYMHKINLISL